MKIVADNGKEFELDREMFEGILTAVFLACNENSKKVYNEWREGLDDTPHRHMTHALDPIMYDSEGRSPFQVKLDRLHEALEHYQNRSDYSEKIRAFISSNW